MIEFRSVSKRFPDGTLAVDDFRLRDSRAQDHGARRVERLAARPRSCA